MVGLIDGTVAFIEATDYLKNERKISFNEIAEKLNLSISQMNMIRVKRRKVKPSEVEKLVKLYPYTQQFFEKQAGQTNEPATPEYMTKEKKQIQLLNEMIEDKRKIIDILENEKKGLLEKIEQLYDELRTAKQDDGKT